MIEIIEKLKKYDDAYYNGLALISDSEYDELKDEAKKLYSDNEYFKVVGATVKSKKIKLPIILGSLNKINNEKSLESWTRKLINKYGYDPDNADTDKYLFMAKVDGISVYVEYENGKVVFASTRGDGEIGQDITDKIKRILPNIPFKGKLSLRGDAILPYDLHKTYGYSNARNGIAGLMNRDEIDDDMCRNIKIIFYETIECNENITSPYQEHNLDLFIKRNGLICAEYDVEHGIKYGLRDIFYLNKKLIECTLKLKKECKKIGYEIDGMVIFPYKYERENVKYPEFKIAYKLKTEGVIVEVQKLEWDVGRTGKLTPVVIIEPTEIDDVTISRISAFNYKYVHTNNINTGAKIKVTRSNEVIPYITEIVEKSSLNENNITEQVKICPFCGVSTIINETNTDIYCINFACKQKNLKKIIYFFSALGTENISLITLNNLSSLINDYTFVNIVKRLLLLSEFDIWGLPGFGQTKAEQIVSEFKKAMTNVTLENFIYAYGIDNVGKKVSKLITNYLKNFYNVNDLDNLEFLFDQNSKDFNSLIDFYTKLMIGLENINGIGKVTAKIFADELHNVVAFYKILKANNLISISQYISEEKISNDLNNIRFALTGNGPLGRDLLIKQIENRGGIVSSVSKKTNYLVAEDINGISGKLKKARELGVRIISYDELIKMIGV